MAIKAQSQITLSCVVDVAATYRYYLLQASTLSPPDKPTKKPPGGSWSDAEPSYTSGSTNTLYFVDLTVFSNGTWAYSSVSKSSAYEAAKEAYNKAQKVTDTVDGLTKVQEGQVLIDGDKVYLSAAFVRSIFAQDITATGTITGAQLIGAILSGNAIDIQAVIDATSIGLKTELVDNSYCLVLSAAGGTTKSSITLSRGSLKLVGQSLLELDTQELAVNANSIQFTVAEGSYCPYYKAGDSVTITRMYCAGGVTGSGTNLYFYIPLAKPLIGVSAVTISNPTKAIITARKVEGGYIAQDATVSSLGTPSCVPYEGGVTIGIKASSAYNTKNNTPVTVTPENLVLKFT